MGMQREFPLGHRRVCPDVCGRQTSRRRDCECVHPDFVDHAWVPLNSPCRNFFRGHCSKEGGCPNLHADTFLEAVYAAFRQHTMKRPSARLHYVQHRSIFKFVTRSEAMDMIQTSLTTSDTMAIKQFIMGMSWTKFATASAYDHHLAQGGVRETDPRTSKGGYGRHRARSPTPTRARFPSPRRARSPSATPTLNRPLQTATSASSTAASAPSFGQPPEPQPHAAPAQAPPVKAMPKDPAAHLATPKRHHHHTTSSQSDGARSHQQPGSCRRPWTTWLHRSQQQHHPAKLLPLSRQTPMRIAGSNCNHAPESAPAYLNTTAPMQSRTPTPSQTSTTTADHDPWNDFSRQRADPIVELVTPAVALARSSSPPRVHNIEPQLGSRPRVVDPSILQAPQHVSTSYSVWDDTWHAQPSPTPQQFPPAALPPLHPAPLSQPAPILRPLAPAAPSQQRSIFTERQGCSSTLPIRAMIPCSLDHAPTAPNPILPQAWGYTGNTLPARAAIVHNTLTPVPAMPAEDVAQFPPGNYPYFAFAPDAPWFVNTSMLQAIEFALDYHVTESRLTDFGLVIQAPNTYRRSPTVERVLIMPLPAQSTDPMVLVTRTYVWALISGDLR